LQHQSWQITDGNRQLLIQVSSSEKTVDNMLVEKPAVSVIVPPMVVHHLDPHTGIPFMPHMAAHLAGAIRAAGYPVQVFDSFGLQHNEVQDLDDFLLIGAHQDWVASRLHPDTAFCFIYCRTMAEFISIDKMSAAIKTRFPNMTICLFENIQAVTSFSLVNVADELLDFDCDILVLGEPERRSDLLIQTLISDAPLEDIPGIVFKSKSGELVCTEAAKLEGELEELPFPAWDLFPLDGYWNSRYAHGPIETDRILPILTSRGCPYKCSFCVIPAINDKWRGRSAKDVVDEMEYFYKTLQVREFHVSDLNPTVNDKRIRAMCEEILSRDLPVIWKLAQGTKIETIKSEKTLELMAKAGCRYVAFSPETGSEALLKTVRKPFDQKHALKMAEKMAKLDIRMQACFVAGLPGETKEDQDLSFAYIKKLLKVGVDEIAVYIFTPIPGAEFEHTMTGYKHYSECTHSPSWRSDYADKVAFRRKVYIALLLSYFLRPRKALRELVSLVTLRFHTKMTMAVFKQMKFYGLKTIPWIFPARDKEAFHRTFQRREAPSVSEEVL
jgi:anaerobic magnesium-protoporphyrin IX monomethyl ester cyclase